MALDLEITESQLLIGIYFPGLDSYYSILFTSDIPQQVEIFLRRELSQFFIECQYSSVFNKVENCFKQSPHLFNNIIRDDLMNLDSGDILIQPLILTYNGEDFDLGLITLLLWGAKSPYGGSCLPEGGISSNYEIPLSSRLKKIFDFWQLFINEGKMLSFHQRSKVYPFKSKEFRDNISRLDLIKFLKNETLSDVVNPSQFVGSLTKQKIKMFINNGVNGISLPTPLEFKDPLRINGDYRSPVEDSYMESWIPLNPEDLVGDLNKITFSKTLMLKDAQLGVMYLTSKVNIPFLSEQKNCSYK